MSYYAKRFFGQQQLPAGAVLHLDASNTLSYSGTGTTWFDLSGNGNNGTMIGDVVFDAVDGGGSMKFNPAGGRIQTNFGPQFTDFTVIAFYKSTGSRLGYNRIVDKGYADGMWLGRESNIINKWGGGVRQSAPPYGRYVSAVDNQWNMITSIREGSNHTIVANGYSSITTGSVAVAPLGTTTFAFGNWTNQNSEERLQGNIGFVIIYPRALTANEVNQIFNSQRSKYGI